MTIKRSTGSYLLIVGIIALMIGGSWLAYEVYAASFRSQIKERQAKNILPLTGRLNDEAISNLKVRREFGATELDRVESLSYEEDVGGASSRVNVESSGEEVVSVENGGGEESLGLKGEARGEIGATESATIQ